MARLCFGTSTLGIANYVITLMKKIDVRDAYIAGRIDGMKQDQLIDLNSKPMDGDAILEGFEATGFSGESFRLRCFNLGVRWAEEYHGIGGKNE